MMISPPPELAPQLTPDELLALFLPLRRDYQRLAVATAGMGFRERSTLIRQRLDRYSEALRRSLSNGADDAALVVRGGRR